MLLDKDGFSLPKTEEQVLAWWRADRIFEKTLAKTARRKKFVFYEGPPTANGQPGLHHVLARAFKDVILRYKTMRGFHVPRKGGWDTHGLPVELEVEKQLGLKTKKDIEKYGIAAFNAKCKESVWKYKSEWERLTERIGFWLDLERPYITYENDYIESLWGIFDEIWKKKLFYRGHKVVPWCTRCGTALSSHELALGYREVSENSVYLKFKLKTKNEKLKTDGDVFILSWTTTPWTLPGNVALAVGKDIKYVMVRAGDENYILAEEIFKNFQFLISNFQSNSNDQNPKAEVIDRIIGSDLVGLEYEPLFNVPALKTKTSYKVYPADFVTTTDGTGVVHTAVMYGEDDYRLGKEVGLPQVHTVDEQGNFTSDVHGFTGLYTKAKETEEKIISYLIEKGFLLKTEPYTHDYPFCWRCGTPLLYYARDSWFVAMSKLRGELLKENKKINWVPEHLREGRFGEWLREVKDWAISRERYWGTPLPLWRCGKCEHTHLVGSIGELERLWGKSKNRYLLVRHGYAESNLENTANHWPERVKRHLTLRGRVQIDALLRRWRWGHVDHIYASDIARTKETEEMLAAAFKGERVHFDPRLRELDTGSLEGKDTAKYHEYFASDLEKFTKRVPGIETLTDLRRRGYEFIGEMEKQYEGKTIVIVSHDYPLWMLESVMRGWTDEEAVAAKHARGGDFFRNGEAREVPFRRIPRDEAGRLDLHRPYIDEVKFRCVSCGGEMKRVPEVADVWFDSGAMPFAQAHWPFAGKRIDYPADYISEAMDQTRGWFYTLLAIGVLLGKGAPYRNVISLGLILDKNGQKMSKSKGNVVNPWEVVEKYGADAVRWYCYTVNPPGEPKRFNEADIGKTLRQFILLLYNSFVFYRTYAKRGNFEAPPDSPNVLDRWITARLHETTALVTEYMDAYDVNAATRLIEDLVEDLSRWYVRRSRGRFQKPASDAEHERASRTLGYALFTLSKLLAPFTPLLAEALHRSLTEKHESVHLADWPKVSFKLKSQNEKLLRDMEAVRRLAGMALAEREKAGIRVRQPLAELKVKNEGLKGERELLNILKDEVNVKTVVFDKRLKEELALDTIITHELQEEGWLRDLTRAVQGLRQDAGCEPKDTVRVNAEVPDELLHVMERYGEEFKRAVNAKVIEYKRSDRFGAEIETKVDKWPVWLAVTKV